MSTTIDRYFAVPEVGAKHLSHNDPSLEIPELPVCALERVSETFQRLTLSHDGRESFLNVNKRDKQGESHIPSEVHCEGQVAAYRTQSASQAAWRGIPDSEVGSCGQQSSSNSFDLHVCGKKDMETPNLDHSARKRLSYTTKHQNRASLRVDDQGSATETEIAVHRGARASLAGGLNLLHRPASVLQSNPRRDKSSPPENSCDKSYKESNGPAFPSKTRSRLSRLPFYRSKTPVQPLHEPKHPPVAQLAQEASLQSSGAAHASRGWDNKRVPALPRQADSATLQFTGAMDAVQTEELFAALGPRIASSSSQTDPSCLPPEISRSSSLEDDISGTSLEPQHGHTEMVPQIMSQVRDARLGLNGPMALDPPPKQYHGRPDAIVRIQTSRNRRQRLLALEKEISRLYLEWLNIRSSK